LISFVALHVVTIAIDKYLPFSVSSLVVPALARYRPLWVAFGMVAAATAHGLGIGTDRNAAWLLTVYTVSVAIVAGAIALRIGQIRPLAVGVALAGAASVVGLAAGQLHVPRRPWNLRTSAGGCRARRTGSPTRPSVSTRSW
jgi:hypothetical protein